MQRRPKPNYNRKRREFSHYQSLYGLDSQELVDFSFNNHRLYFKCFLWDINHICQGCKDNIATFEDATLDHIYPKSLGGFTRLNNLQLMHRTCNSAKSNKVLGYISKHRITLMCTPLRKNT